MYSQQAWTIADNAGDRGQCYLHQFLNEEPDLNLRSTLVQEELDVNRYIYYLLIHVVSSNVFRSSSDMSVGSHLLVIYTQSIYLAYYLYVQDILRYWLDLGVDGFRVNSVKYLFEDTDLRDEIQIPGCNNAVRQIILLSLPGHTLSQWVSHQLLSCDFTYTE